MKTQSLKFLFLICCVASGIWMTGCSGSESGGPLADHLIENLDKSSKEASLHTKTVYKSVKDSLFSTQNTQDFTDATKGFIATLPNDSIKDTLGNVVFNLGIYDFIEEGSATDATGPKSVNPSLYRQSWLNAQHGLFEVQEGTIYQIRAFDLANMTLVKGKSHTGVENHKWIVIDPLGSPPTARAGLKLFREKIDPEAVFSDVIFTHSHIDHFGGIRGVVEDLDAINIWAPEGFFEEGVSENIMAGNCMGRRASYMYGNVLPKNDKGTVGTGLGTTTSTGLAGIVEPDESRIISDLDMVTRRVAGLEVEFIYTPSSEAPAEMMFYFKDYKAFCQAEDLNHTLHNLYTLRGAKVRNGQKWSQYIDKAIQLWGDETEVSFGSHHWPTWDKANILPFWKKQRDTYRFLHDQSLRLANQGYTSRELAEMITLPTALNQEFYNRGYYGSYSHDIKAQYQLYFGWFDGNPANLNPLPPVAGGKKYVEFMGGPEAVLEKSAQSFLKGDYRFTAEVLNHLVFSEEGGPKTKRKAKLLLADTYEQLGYQAESGPWRNFYLSGASDLRNGVDESIQSPDVAAPDMIVGMSNDLLFNFLAMRFDGLDKEATEMEYTFHIKMDDVLEDNDTTGNVILVVSNGAVSPRIGQTDAENITDVVTMDRVYWNEFISGISTYDQLVTDGKVTFANSGTEFGKFMGKIDEFTFWFNIVTP